MISLKIPLGSLYFKHFFCSGPRFCLEVAPLFYFLPLVMSSVVVVPLEPCLCFFLVNCSTVDCSHSETGATPLMMSAARGFVTQMQQLLSIGADLNKRESNGWYDLSVFKVLVSFLIFHFTNGSVFSMSNLRPLH